MTYHPICNKSNRTYFFTSTVVTANLSETPEFTRGFKWGLCCLRYCKLFWRLLFFVLFLLTIALSVLLWFTNSDLPSGILKLLLIRIIDKLVTNCWHLRGTCNYPLISFMNFKCLQIIWKWYFVVLSVVLGRPSTIVSGRIGNNSHKNDIKTYNFRIKSRMCKTSLEISDTQWIEKTLKPHKHEIITYII